MSENIFEPITMKVALGGLVVIVFVVGLEVRGFRPGQGQWIFKGDKNP
jgi:hypothetical protein